MKHFILLKNWSRSGAFISFTIEFDVLPSSASSAGVVLGQVQGHKCTGKSMFVGIIANVCKALFPLVKDTCTWGNENFRNFSKHYGNFLQFYILCNVVLIRTASLLKKDPSGCHPRLQILKCYI